MKLVPAFLSGTYRSTTATMSTRLSSVWINSFGIMVLTPPDHGIADVHHGAHEIHYRRRFRVCQKSARVLTGARADPPLPSAVEPALDLGRHQAHVGPPRQLRPDSRHNLAHRRHPHGPALCDIRYGGGDQPLDLRFR